MMFKKKYRRKIDSALILSFLWFVCSVITLYVLYSNVSSFYDTSISFISWLFSFSQQSFITLIWQTIKDLVISGILQYQSVKASVLVLALLSFIFIYLSLRYLFSAVHRCLYSQRNDMIMPKYESVDFIQYQLQPLIRKEKEGALLLEECLIRLKFSLKDHGAFGYSNKEVCECENEIANKLYDLYDIMLNKYVLQDIIKKISDIQILIQKRIQLKRK